ncbi:MAG: hypothetical protein KME49_30330 [Brasilonema octagenarum HA4186-MV1]|jgi:hypothetical protein|uniref:Uncharacterized protein n=2 Tax=Brasilonema TaxID=383614 RepID=A0A856MHE2_9CYAN|nr:MULTISPECIES: hypothetical protein [Brasilonema]MBW4629693.1 hypothetical protein [Brasilonema octagenarum HA4186-MV1]NMF63756.1 hypothetical protein [Brasilonema octagenarum UFV-OR1]QDL09664.1 hypothetical protein DP114_18750 [Brasilonema sennae CENA114]QDL16018.1 hypothetical protein DP113_18680 [Brasilonema octagenarum UFV-E1]
MDEIVKKLAGLGLPGIILVILTATAGGSSAAVAAALTAVGGPFGIVGGIGLLGLITVLGDTIAGYGIEAILKAVYAERSKTESVRFLLKEINDLPISDELKLKLKNHISSETNTYTVPSDEPRTVEIVEE